ncbi:hypothetical protein GCM10023067_47560 [Aminobacter aganoensis]
MYGWSDPTARPCRTVHPRRQDSAIGIRLRRWVSFHGIAINVEPELGHFSGIVPCGVTDHGVTSLVDLGLPVTMSDLDVALKAAFEEIFGPADMIAESVRKTA